MTPAQHDPQQLIESLDRDLAAVLCCCALRLARASTTEELDLAWKHYWGRKNGLLSSLLRAHGQLERAAAAET